MHQRLRKRENGDSWWDDSSNAPTLYEPSQDPQETANTGIDEIPRPTWNHTCLLPAPWGMYINPNVSISEQLAGYKFLKYMTSPQEQIRGGEYREEHAVATRPAPLNYVIAHASKFQTPIEYLKAIQHSSQHIEPNAIPVTAAFVPIQDSLFIILSELINAQVTPQQTLQKLQSHMVATL